MKNSPAERAVQKLIEEARLKYQEHKNGKEHKKQLAEFATRIEKLANSNSGAFFSYHECSECMEFEKDIKNLVSLLESP